MNNRYKALRLRVAAPTVYTENQKLQLINQKDFKNKIACGSIKFRLSVLDDLVAGRVFNQQEINYNLLKFNAESIQGLKNSKDILAYVGDARLRKYFDIEPTLDNICAHFHFDLPSLEMAERIEHERQFEKARLDELKKQELARQNELNKQAILTELSQIEATYENVAKLLADEQFNAKFIRYINRECSIITIYKALGKTKKFALEAIQAQKLVEHRIYIDSFKNRTELPLRELINLSRLPLNEVMFGKAVAVKDFAKYLNIKINKKQYSEEIAIDKKADDIVNKYGYSGKSNIHNMHIEKILSISKTELDKWKKEGKLVSAERKAFSKWGRSLESDYFDARFLATITPEIISLWRETDKIKKLEIPTTKIDKIATLTLALKEHNIFFTTKWYKGVELSLDGHTIKSLIEFDVPFTLDKLATKRNAKTVVLDASNTVDIAKNTKKLLREIHKYALDEQQELYLKQQLELAYTKLDYSDLKLSTFNSLCVEFLKKILSARQFEDAIQMTKIQDFEQSFTLARKLKRQIHLIVGPTNSGKTYEALQALKKAKSGIYLAPLRLLAMEIYDRLNAEGVPCNLITGEEQIMVSGAHHTASTIEMANYQDKVEVAVIDEFQMLGDKERGWAWTSAMIGIPASTVYVLGNQQGLKLAQQLFEYLGEQVKVTTTQRLSPLEITPMVRIEHLKEGDAIIAFSRKDVLSYASLCKQKGFKVSIIYGALSPEVRRHQAELFNTGVNQIIVSTDAIGMGLNLPIKRILFATLNKFDGTQVRTLADVELLQIAGRAGRYNINDKGYVTLLGNKVNTKDTFKQLKQSLDKPYLENLLVCPIAPHSWHLETLSKILNTQKLDILLDYFTTLRQESLLQCADLSKVSTIYKNLASDLDKFELVDKYKLACAPTDDTPEMLNYYRSLLLNIRDDKPCGFVVPKYVSEDSKNYSYLEEAELCSKKLSLYAWLSFHYDIFDKDSIRPARDLLSKYIAKALLKHNSVRFSQMIEPVIHKKRKHYNDGEYNDYDDDDDDDYMYG